MDPQTIGLTQHLKARGKPIVYVGDGVTINVTRSIPGRTTFKFEDNYGHTLRVVTHDWIFETSYLVDDYVCRPPKSGHLIKVAKPGNRVAIYRVEAPNNEPFWRYADEEQFCLRIHTVFQREETLP